MKIKRIIVVQLILIALLGLCGCVERQPITKEQAISRFTRLTGISFTNEMMVLGFKDDHRGLSSEGEFSIAIKMPEPAITAIINDVPPLGGNWRRGPVEGEIGFHCAFIYSDSPGYGGIVGEERYHGGSPEAVDILSSTGVVYCAKHRGPESMPWHNGILLVVRPSDGTLWLSSWDW